jgi:hypothetical protein
MRSLALLPAQKSLRRCGFTGSAAYNILEWLYLLRSAKLCAVHNAQSGPLTDAKNLCAVAALPTALHTTSQKHLFWLSAIN